MLGLESKESKWRRMERSQENKKISQNFSLLWRSQWTRKPTQAKATGWAASRVIQYRHWYHLFALWLHGCCKKIFNYFMKRNIPINVHEVKLRTADSVGTFSCHGWCRVDTINTRFSPFVPTMCPWKFCRKRLDHEEQSQGDQRAVIRNHTRSCDLLSNADTLHSRNYCKGFNWTFAG